MVMDGDGGCPWVPVGAAGRESKIGLDLTAGSCGDRTSAGWPSCVVHKPRRARRPQGPAPRPRHADLRTLGVTGGAGVFEDGIGLEEIFFIQREQFVYFLEMERRLNHPTDWEAFRLGLVGALTAAWGLNTRYPAGQLRHELLSVPQRRALHLLDRDPPDLRTSPPPTGFASAKETGWVSVQSGFNVTR